MANSSGSSVMSIFFGSFRWRRRGDRACAPFDGSNANRSLSSFEKCRGTARRRTEHPQGDLTMDAKPNELKNELKKGLDLLRTLRDEVRVRLHLTGMELKEQWNKLEPYVADVEKAAGNVSEASRAKVAEAVKKLQEFRASLR